MKAQVWFVRYCVSCRILFFSVLDCVNDVSIVRISHTATYRKEDARGAAAFLKMT